VGLILHLLLKVALLSALSGGLLLAVPLAAAVGRWLVLLAAHQPQARPGGLGAAFAAGLHWRVDAGAAILPLGLILALGLRGMLAALAALLVAFAVLGLARRRLGGVTGDVMGMVIELAELAVLLGFLAAWPPVL
jgi:adenosylcobinamide-GDP ribazoletransferase